MTKGTWGRYSPSRKMDMIGEVYEADNSSASDLASRLFRRFGVEVTRNAIIGTYGRSPDLAAKYPLTGVKPARVKPTPSSSSEYIKKQVARIKEDAVMRTAKRTLISPIAAPVLEPETSQRIANRRQRYQDWNKSHARNVTLLELGSGECKWPVTETKPFLFCGCATSIVKQVRRPYCAFHDKLAHTPLGADDD